MTDILKIFNFPEDAYINKRIPLKVIVEQMKLNRADEKLLRNHIASLHLAAILDSQTIRLNEFNNDLYRYEEIQIFEIQLKTKNKVISLHKKMHTIFPNPTIFITEYLDEYIVSLSDKRISKVNQEGSVVEQVYMSQEITLENVDKNFERQLDFKKNTLKNLYQMYQHYQNAIYSHQLIDLLGEYPKNLLDVSYIKDKLNYIASIDAQINQLNEGRKEDISMSEKMDRHKKIKKLVKSKNDIVEEIREVDNHG